MWINQDGNCWNNGDLDFAANHVAMDSWQSSEQSSSRCYQHVAFRGCKQERYLLLCLLHLFDVAFYIWLIEHDTTSFDLRMQR